MSKHIEVGCLALIVSSEISENIGKIVTVVDYDLDPNREQAADWEIEGDVRGLRPWAVFPGVWTKESNLLRIDDYTEEADTQEQELTV